MIMKKLMCLILATVLLTAGCVSALAEEPMLAGGWTASETPEVTEDARAAFDKAMEDFVGVGYEPVALLGTQVVAGLNYCLLCKAVTVTLEPRTFYALVYIYAALDGSAQVLDIQEIDLGIRASFEEPAEEDGQNPVMNLIGVYQDETSGRASMTIACTGADGADVCIVWGDSASTSVEWTFTGPYNETAGNICYTDCEKRVRTFDEQGNETVTVEYENGEGELQVMADYSIRWNDRTENAGEECVFVFIGNPEI